VGAELVPAAVAVGGGSALLGGIYLHERRQWAAMRASRERLGLRFPIGAGVEAAAAALVGLSGLRQPVELVAETWAEEHGIRHSLLVPGAVRRSVSAGLTGVLPGLRVLASEEPSGTSTVAVRLFVSTPAFLRTDGVELAARALLSGLATLREGEQVVLRWALRPESAPERRGEPTDRRGRELERAWRRKTDGPGFRVAGLVVIQAAGAARARELAEHVVASLRSRGTAALRPTWERSGRSLASLPHAAAEALGLLAWPLGAEAVPGVMVGAARELPVPRQVAAEGRRLFIGRDGSGERPVALSPQAGLHHLAVVGPTGVGKSALLANAVLQDIGAGYGGAVLDPKDDLVEAVLDRVPEQHAERVVVLDPAADMGVPGLALLSAGDPELRSDVIVGALKSIFHASWGIRSELYLRLAVRTLAEIPGAALADMGRLFADGPYRRAAVRRLRDPFLVASWKGYEGLSAGEKAQHISVPDGQGDGAAQPSLGQARAVQPRPPARHPLVAARAEVVAGPAGTGSLG